MPVRLLSVLALVVGTTLMPSAALAAPPPKDETPKKVYVCKYVGTPGHGERLQNGQNPIEVSVNTLPSSFAGTFPSAFPDAHGRSMAIGWVGDGNPVLTVSSCPAADTGETETPPPPPPPPTDTGDGDQTPTPAPAVKKVYVCKYVGTPGKETLQTGQNPIEVSVNALPDGFPGTFPWTFSDAQGRSEAIAWVGDAATAPTAADCTPDVDPPVDPEPTDPGTEQPPVVKKVYVCKYVGTPGKETLQTGQNPIEVSVNALPDGFPGTFPWTFSDAQGRSEAIAWVGDAATAPTAADCTPDVVVDPEPVTVTPAWVTSPTCEGDASSPQQATISPVTGVTGTFTTGDGATGPWTITYTADDGYTLVDGDGTALPDPYTVSGDAGTVADCDEVVVVDPQPTAVVPLWSTTPTCGTDSRSALLTGSPIGEQATITSVTGIDARFATGDGLEGPWMITFTADEGYTLVDGDGTALPDPYTVSGDAGTAADCDEVVVVDPEPVQVSPGLQLTARCTDDATATVLTTALLQHATLVDVPGVDADFTEGDGVTGPWSATFTAQDGYTLVDAAGDALPDPYVVTGDAGVAADCDEVVVVDPVEVVDPVDSSTPRATPAGAVLPDTGGTPWWLLVSGFSLTLLGALAVRRGEGRPTITGGRHRL